MIISRLTAEGDWTFGRGIANYAKDNEAVGENIKSRLKSFANDWFLDTDANIDWVSILSVKNNKNLILSEVSRVISESDGVIKILSLDLTTNSARDRSVTILALVSTVFNNQQFITVDIQ